METKDDRREPEKGNKFLYLTCQTRPRIIISFVLTEAFSELRDCAASAVAPGVSNTRPQAVVGHSVPTCLTNYSERERESAPTRWDCQNSNVAQRVYFVHDMLVL